MSSPPSIESLFIRSAALPTVPRVVGHLVQSLSRPDVPLSEAAAWLEADPVLSARALRLANSSYLHLTRKVATVDSALQVLGFDTMRRLVLGVGISSSFRSVPGFDLRQFWRYSLHTACSSRWLAGQVGADPELAFTVGLVHGLGQLILHRAEPQAMAGLDRSCHPLASERAESEVRALGFHHCEVSAELALRWHFPMEVTHPLRLVPDPLACDPPMTVAALVHIGAWRASVAALAQAGDESPAGCPTAVGKELGLRFDWLPQDATIGGSGEGAMPPMPPLAQLTHGIESIFD